MRLKLKRAAKKDGYTIGHLYDMTSGCTFLADTLEDTDRGLTQRMTEAQIAAVKVKGATAIPAGTYTVTLNVVSPKYSRKSWYVVNCDGARMPRLLEVKGYQGVLVHPGNTASDTEGCVLVGENKEVGKVVNSRATFLKLYKRLKAAADSGETITITIC